MSYTHSTSTSSDFKVIFNNALKTYKKRTKEDLLTHPLADLLEAYDSPSGILALLQEQEQEADVSQRSNVEWLDPTMHVLHTFSEALGIGGVGSMSPSKVIFISFSVLLSTAKAVRADQDALFEMLERIGSFFRRLDIYTEVAPDQGMVDTITAIMVEILNFIGIVTKEIKQGRMIKYIKKLMGKNNIEDALKKLDRLTQEEARNAAALLLNVTVDYRVGGVADDVLVVGDSVAGSDDHVQGFDDNLMADMDDGNEESEVTQQSAHGVDQIERNQQRQILSWLSPPDLSTNHNIAISCHHKQTATWFLEGETYKGWKSQSTDSDSLLWIYGRPGSGKTILCSTIIEDVKTLCHAGQAMIGYFYFDFRDIDKQHWRNLIPSLLVQLSTQSSPCCDILSRLYFSHRNGAQRPDDDALKWCLMEMLTVLDRHPIYLIMDALDESSDTSETPSSRNQILQLLEELDDLRIPNLRICVTSRPEVDIRNVLEPLTSHRVSLHDQSGQRKDIENYVRSIVYSESQIRMRRWRKEDKELVIETLSERADGMFRWTFCQLETLHGCFPSSVRRTLRELPESLNETYERILKEIKKPNRDFARRLLQCLVVATRPLRVGELAEVLAVDFDDAEGIPRLNSDWRCEDQEQALLIACSSLITIVEADHSDSEAETDDGESRVEAGDLRTVQFSHFSVKEFLTLPRLASASGGFSNYYIDLEPAHLILAQVCLGVLLQIQDDVEGCTPEDHPLSRYAAEHWTAHAQFEDVSLRLHNGMKYLFDADKPHFEIWLTLCDIDTKPNKDATFYWFVPDGRKSPATPLYYAALCGFHDLVGDLIIKHPEDLNADGGHYVRPLVAALAGGHFRTADLLHHKGAELYVRGQYGRNPLHAAAISGNLEIVRKLLIDYDSADINATDDGGWTALLWASGGRHFKDGSVLRLLLEYGADIHLQTQNGWTPLHWASFNGALEVVRLLLEHGADVEAKIKNGKTALQLAADRGLDEVVKLLREHGAR